MKKIILYLLFLILLNSCISIKNIPENIFPARNDYAISGAEFIQKIDTLQRDRREEEIKNEILSGNFPDFLRKWVKINVSITTPTNKKITAYYYVLPDYLMIGTNSDFCRIPMQPETAQYIADRFNCFLSTRKICNDVYKRAKIKLEPIPLTEHRDSVSTFLIHNQLIEDQRKGRKGLIAGIKKDVVISAALIKNNKPNRVAIYGWHKLDGKPIQPLYTGHVDWYVDYSHGIRLVWQTIFVDGKPINYTKVLNNPLLAPLICDEKDCCFYKYPAKE